MAIAGGLGLEADLSKVAIDIGKGKLYDDTLLFSESAGRFMVTVCPRHQEIYEKLFKGMPISCIGKVTDSHNSLKINSMAGKPIVNLSIEALEASFTKPFGDYI